MSFKEVAQDVAAGIVYGIAVSALVGALLAGVITVKELRATERKLDAIQKTLAR